VAPFFEMDVLSLILLRSSTFCQTSGAEVSKRSQTSMCKRLEAKTGKRQTLTQISVIEVALMRMFLIEKFELTKSPAMDKMEAFCSFLRDLDTVLAREAHLALHYFHDKAGRLLGIQPNTPIERALSTIRSTAWDLLLLRVPEFSFSGDPEELRLGYIATQESSLAALAKLFTIASIHGDRSASRGLPLVAYDAAGLPPDVEIPDFGARPRSEIPKRLPVGLHEALVAELRRVLPH
jgi:hypothetical protein